MYLIMYNDTIVGIPTYYVKLKIANIFNCQLFYCQTTYNYCRIMCPVNEKNF